MVFPASDMDRTMAFRMSFLAPAFKQLDGLPNITSSGR